MTPLAVVQLIMSLEPAVQDMVVSLIAALKTKDAAAERTAVEAALRLQFEARQKP